ncbi:hypothetical protein P7C70_g2627, partial [Phenoliferia sp. Uapishka_3]
MAITLPAATRAVQLYGGAITTILPSNLRDASELRQVPDSQEVWLDNDSNLSFILEVVQLVTESGAVDDLDAALRFHFNSLAHDNTALSATISSISLPTNFNNSSNTSIPTFGPATLSGRQTVSKFNLPPERADVVLVLMALWRLPSKNTDLVLCVNFPVSEEGGPEIDSTTAKKVFADAAHRLAIVDYGLFAG